MESLLSFNENERPLFPAVLDILNDIRQSLHIDDFNIFVSGNQCLFEPCYFEERFPGVLTENVKFEVRRSYLI